MEFLVAVGQTKGGDGAYPIATQLGATEPCNGYQMERISRARDAVVLADAKRRYEERLKKGVAPDDPPLLEEGWGEITLLCAVGGGVMG